MVDAVLGRGTASALGSAEQCCFHCNEAVNRYAPWTIEFDGVCYPMCCAGCQAVAEAILGAGLEAFYRLREAPSQTPRVRDPGLEMLAALDQPAVQARFVTSGADYREALLALEGLSCAACAWLIEKRLTRVPGVLLCEVDFAGRRTRVQWQPERVKLSEIISAMRDLGFDAAPFDPIHQGARLTREFRTELRRAGIAGLCAMQVMMITTALYFDSTAAADRPYGAFLNWLCAGLSLPVVSYCALPFYRGAWRACRARVLTMDVLVSLGIALAFVGSVVALSRPDEAVYFDSVTMFVSLLLVSRLVEMRALLRAARYFASFECIEPVSVQRLSATPDGEVSDAVLVNELLVGDRIRVRPDQRIPVDGLVVKGSSTVDRKVLTGESAPVPVAPGSTVTGGSTNVTAPLDIEVTAIGEATVLAQIGQLARRAQSTKLTVLDPMRRAAAVFVWIVLGLALITIVYHGVWRGAPWLAPTLAVLVISCPCALALGAPTALSVAVSTLLRRGVLVVNANALLAFASVTRLVLDKTGTLTAGELELRRIEWGARVADRTRLTAIAARFALDTAHPIASAFRDFDPDELPIVQDLAYQPGYGSTGVIDGEVMVFGSAALLRAEVPRCVLPPLEPATVDKVVYLATGATLLACFHFHDALRPEAREAVAYFRDHGIDLTIISGDRREAVAAVANELDLVDAAAGCDPAVKLAELAARSTGENACIAVVGDGLNDTPMLAGADIAISLGTATSAAQLRADLLLLNSNLLGLVISHRIAVRLRQVMHQNISWALAYNFVALPLALGGFVAPWVAALLMASSSGLVVANANRIARTN